MNLSGTFISNLQESVYSTNTDSLFAAINHENYLKGIRGRIASVVSSSYSATSSLSLNIDTTSASNQQLNTYNDVYFNTLTISGGYFNFSGSYSFPVAGGVPSQMMVVQSGSQLLLWDDTPELDSELAYTLIGTTHTGSTSNLLYNQTASFGIPLNDVWYCNMNVCCSDKDGLTSEVTVRFVVKNVSGSVSIINGIKNNEQLMETGLSGSYKMYMISSVASELSSSWLSILPSGSSLYTTIRNPSETSYSNWKALLYAHECRMV